MTKQELIKLLEPYPDDIKIWVSDEGYCEGGRILQDVHHIPAIDACLDGDDMDDEVIYRSMYSDEEWENKNFDLSEYHEKIYKLPHNKEEIVYYKNILLIRS